MLRSAIGFACALVLLPFLLCGSRASAQERVDSSIRAWADIDFYFGDTVYDTPGSDLTAVLPVLRGEIELSSWQLGLDLPFALGWIDVDLPGFAGMEGSGAELANPTLHLDYLMEKGSLRGTVGFALAIPTDDDGPEDLDDTAARVASLAGARAHGLWNAWWYLPDTWTLVVPASIEDSDSKRELGLEGGLAWYLPRADGVDNFGTLQIGGHAALVSKPLVVGLRLRGVFLIDDAFVIGGDDDSFQSSAEIYAELRLPIIWLGAGVNACLDEPLGVFGDPPNMWTLRISGGASF